jgi:hypothetical protein
MSHAATVRRVGCVIVALALSACSTPSVQKDQLALLDSCVEPHDHAYSSMVNQAINAMNEQDLDLAEVLTGLEASARIRDTPGASLSSEDSRFLTRHRFISFYGGTAFTTSRFVAARTCLEQRYGMKVRVIEIRPP